MRALLAFVNPPRPRRLAPVGACVPGLVVRVLPAVVAVPLTFLAWPQSAARVAALVLVAAAVAVPRFLLAWPLIAFLASSQFTRDPALEFRFFVLLAGLHLLHVLAARSIDAPLRGWVQLATLARPLMRFVAIQVPAQAIAFAALALLSPDSGGSRPYTVTAFSLLGAVALVVTAVALVQPLLRERSRLRNAWTPPGEENRSGGYGR